MTENDNETPVRDAPPPSLKAADFGAAPATPRRRAPRRRAVDEAATTESAVSAAGEPADTAATSATVAETEVAPVGPVDPGDPTPPARAPRRRGGRTRREPAPEVTAEEAAVISVDTELTFITTEAETLAPPATTAPDPSNSWSTGRRYEIGPDGKVRYLDPGAPTAPAAEPAPRSQAPSPPTRPDRSDTFAWQPGDITITPPPAAISSVESAAESGSSYGEATAEEDDEIRQALAQAGDRHTGAVEDPDLAPGLGDEGEPSEAVRRRRRSRRGGRGRSRNGNGAEGVLAEAESIAAEAMDIEIDADEYEAPDPAPAAIVPAPLIAPPSSPTPAARPPSLSPLEQLVARQNVILDQLMQRQQEMARSMERALTTVERRLAGTDLTRVSAMPRVGVFVDVPNIMYAADRYNIAVDFGKLLDLVAQDRTLIRASAYAPISDDPTLRLEVQRFVQPFLGHGYRIVTKPLKRFNDGSIKANFDIELAMDILTMSERMDIVVLVSGDGDFHRLVELVQSKGVRVEVVAFAASTATELKAVADSYVDLTNHLRDLSVTR